MEAQTKTIQFAERRSYKLKGENVMLYDNVVGTRRHAFVEPERNYVFLNTKM